jgi:hypothetical protein
MLSHLLVAVVGFAIGAYIGGRFLTFGKKGGPS